MPAKKTPKEPVTPRKQKLKAELQTVKADFKRAKRSLENEEKELTDMSVELRHLQDFVDVTKEMTNQSEDRENQIKELESQYRIVSKELEQTSQKLNHATEKLSNYTPRNVNKRLKRKEEKVQCQKQEIDKLEKETRQQQELLQTMAEKLNKTVKEKTNLQKRVSRLKIQLKNTETVDERIESNEVEIEELRKTIGNLEKENELLHTMPEITEEKEVNSFCNGEYTNEVREVILELLNLNVSAKNASHVIRCVVEKLTSYKVDKLPSNATSLMIGIEGRLLASMQAAKAGTSRQKRQYNVTQVGTDDGLFTLGLREMVGENATTVLECSKMALNEAAKLIARLQHTNEDEELESRVTSCDNTMSDRGAIMKAFNREYEEWRASIVSATAGFKDLPPEEQEALLKVENFYCFMHVHINQATYAEDSLKLLDQAALDVNKEELPGNYRPTSTSSTSSAIYAATKAFERHGDEQAGPTADFEAHLASHEMKLMFKKNIGNRAQILFENGAAYIYHKEDMKTFLRMRKGEADLNNLLKAVGFIWGTRLLQQGLMHLEFCSMLFPSQCG